MPIPFKIVVSRLDKACVFMIFLKLFIVFVVILHNQLKSSN